MEDDLRAGRIGVIATAHRTEPLYRPVGGTIEVHDAHRSYGTVPAYRDPMAYGAPNVDLGRLAAGTYTLTAVYSGDDEMAPSSSTTTFTVRKRPSLAWVHAEVGRGPTDCPPPFRSCPSPDVAAGTEIAFTGGGHDKDTWYNDPPLPTGAATFFDNGVPVATRNIVDGSARWDVILPPGDHNMTTSYSGDGFYEPASTGNSFRFVRVLAPGAPPTPPLHIVGGPPARASSAASATTRHTEPAPAAGATSPSTAPASKIEVSEPASDPEITILGRDVAVVDAPTAAAPLSAWPLGLAVVGAGSTGGATALAVWRRRRTTRARDAG